MRIFSVDALHRNCDRSNAVIDEVLIFSNALPLTLAKILLKIQDQGPLAVFFHLGDHGVALEGRDADFGGVVAGTLFLYV